MADFFDNFLEILKLHSGAIVVEKSGGYALINDSAKKLLCKDGVPLPLSEWVPEDILSAEAPGASGYTELYGNRYSVDMSRFGDHRVFSIIPLKKESEETFELISLLADSIKAPLAMLSSAANSMLPIVEGSGSDILSKNLAVIYKNYYKLVRLSNVLSGYYEIKTNNKKLNLNQVDLLALCSNLVDTVSLLTKERGVRIWFKTNLENAYTEADFDKIEYVLLNLLSIGLKYTKTGDDIIVDLTRSSDFFVITASVIGAVLPDYLLQKLFEPKLNFKNMQDSDPELGLGFSYSSYIIEAHGGSMIMESRMDPSTTIKFTLPIKAGNKFADTPIRYGENGIVPILTELSDILSLDCYDAKYMD